MTREELIQAVETVREETKIALEIIYNSLSQEQKDFLTQDERVNKLFNTYDVEYN